MTDDGAKALCRTLVDSDVTVCFANPGTSEMHFVAALDDVPDMRGILCLFEGVATGAADGYARMTQKPAATLLHLGPGLANGLANLHNARRAHSPIVNVVGDHAIDHKALDAPLESDIDALARTVSTDVVRPRLPDDVGPAAAAAVATSIERRGIVTVVLHADTSWSGPASTAQPLTPRPQRRVSDGRIRATREALDHGDRCVIVAGGAALRDAATLADLSRIAAATGARFLAETFPARLHRGAGIAPVERLGYFAEHATEQLAGVSHAVLVDVPEPVAFFAYPDRPGRLLPVDAHVAVLTGTEDDTAAALRALADDLAPNTSPVLAAADRPDAPSGPLNPQTFAAAIAAHLPEHAIVSDEANTAGIFLSGATAGCPPHDWLTLTGGAIGQGLPVAVGAAVACPDRKVIAIEADGSSLYTVQALWTMVREQLDITVVTLTNETYAILNLELDRVGASAGRHARRLLDLTPPSIDLATVAAGLGMPSTAVTTADAFATAFAAAMASRGPRLIDVRLVQDA